MLGIVIDIFLGGSSEQRANDWFNANLSGLVAGIDIFFIVSNAISLSAVAQLLQFHIGLQRKNLTTYQFIVTDNARRREAFQHKEEQRSKRVVAVSKARQEGKRVLALRLEMGQFCCAVCDPLPDEEAPADAAPNGVVAANTRGTSGYAELSDGGDAGAASTDEKTSMTSERDPAHMNATSLGESSSSQLEAKQEEEDVVAAASVTAERDLPHAHAASLGESSPLEPKQEEGVVTAENSAQDLPMETSKEESNGVNVVEAAETTDNHKTDFTSNDAQEASNNVQGAAENVEEAGNRAHKATEDVESPVEPKSVESEKDI